MHNVTSVYQLNFKTDVASRSLFYCSLFVSRFTERFSRVVTNLDKFYDALTALEEALVLVRFCFVFSLR